MRGLLLLGFMGCTLGEIGVDPDGSRWMATTHPCPGYNRTDALWVDADERTWLGCGSAAEGTGLFRSDSWGNWASVDGFESWRVLSIHRSESGTLWVGGTDTDAGNRMVVALDADGALTEVYSASEPVTVGERFVVGNAVQTPDGRAFIESLTGTDTLMRAAGGGEFTMVSPYTDGGSYQILDVALDGDVLVGAGSTISQPPTIFVPDAPTDESPFRLRPVSLEDAESTVRGELWGLAVDDGWIVAGGVDQMADRGIFYRVSTSGTDVTKVDVGELIGRTVPTWVRGVCTGGGKWAVVGEESRSTGRGFILFSDDGATFREVTPSEGDVPKVFSKCRFTADGDLIVAGSDGWVGRLPG